jgi:tetratricopeptide (TPR) repeat protein
MPAAARRASRGTRILIVAAAVLIVQSAYLLVDSSPSAFYVANVLAHFLAGVVITVPIVVTALRTLRRLGNSSVRALGGVALALFVASVLAAIVLVWIENVRAHAWLAIVHAALAGSALLVTLGLLLAQRRAGGAAVESAWRLGRAAVAAAALVVVAFLVARHLVGGERDVVVNPFRPPATMSEEAMGGADGYFFPSSAETSTKGRVPSTFFMTSEACARCHADIFNQWKSSAHHFSSFNNQWYRKSIEYMQEVNSIQSSKWCGGCHDHAVLFNGMMDDPVSAFIATEEAHTGLGCNSCHAITHVKDTMGQGGFHIRYPPLHDLAVSRNAVLRGIHDFALRLDAAPHREVFLQRFHREQRGEFCSACHKVHLDVPVNNYRWIRGFNEYDNWQASGVSGQGARSFYYPPAPRDCADCHMPRVPSRDKGNQDGMVHDHSFIAANTALPYANLDERQLRRTIEFLQQQQVTLDIFATGPAREIPASAASPREGAPPQIESAFAIGEEAAAPVGLRPTSGAREPSPVWAPLDRTAVAVRRGEDVCVDVVARTRGVGHFFPGGTVDAFDVWLELRAVDSRGRTVFWSGVATDGGRGQVDPGAHFYRARMLDAHGNVIDKRNAWATRAVAWVNLIPPGAADVAHFRLSVPDDCGDEITLEARLNYRKFMFENTRFAFAGRPADGEPPRPGPGVENVTKHFDDREFVFDHVPIDASAALREVPDLPIVVMDRKTAKLRVVDRDAHVANPAPEPSPLDRERWNDYGIGLLRQGDFQGARRAFQMVVSSDPSYADGYVNLGRVGLQEGLLDEAFEALREALLRAPDLAKTHYFLGVVHKARGDYDAALTHLRAAAERYPHDRVVQNDIGRVLFLQRRYAEAVDQLQRVLAVDPEDVTAHYNLMLCYRGLGDEESAAASERLYERFKADEDSQMILGPFVRANAGENRMRQLIHEQRSVPPDVIAHEAALRAEHGEPNVVLPGGAEAFARQVVERGASLLAAGKGSRRHQGPTESGSYRTEAPELAAVPAPELAATADPSSATAPE